MSSMLLRYFLYSIIISRALCVAWEAFHLSELMDVCSRPESCFKRETIASTQAKYAQVH